MAYSQDLREPVLDFVAQGHSKQEAAEHYQIGISTVYLWCKTPEKVKADKPGPNRKEFIEQIAPIPPETTVESVKY